MLETRTILILAAAGLLLPILIIGLRQSDTLLRTDAMNCNQVTAHLERIDYTARLPDSPVLIVGDTTARDWPMALDTLAGRPVLVRSLAGLSAAAVANCFSRLVGHYRPSTVVMLLDDNDLAKLETELRGDVRAISSSMTNLNSNMQMIVTGLIRTPARDNNRVDLLNRAVAAETNRLPDARFVDPNAPLTNSSGQPDPQRFWPNGRTLGKDSIGEIAVLIEGALHRLTLSRDGV